jgi:hypothetical protein
VDMPRKLFVFVCLCKFVGYKCTIFNVVHNIEIEDFSVESLSINQLSVC